jgi:large subunit ribosomal protein L2
MGKRIISRARGKGGPRYRAPSHRYRGKVKYAKAEKAKGVVVDIVHDVGRSAPVAIVKFESGEKLLHVAPEGLYVGDTIEYGGKAEVGNVLKLSDLPVGTKVSGIESYYGSGPKFCRSSGSFATVANVSADKVTLQFSSGKLKDFKGSCRATIGVPAGGGRLEKPWAKAGKRVHAKMARGKLYPRTVGVAMTATDHPFGGSRKAPRPSGSVSRHAPPGAKVGSISPRRVGKKKKK